MVTWTHPLKKVGLRFGSCATASFAACRGSRRMAFSQGVFSLTIYSIHVLLYLHNANFIKMGETAEKKYQQGGA